MNGVFVCAGGRVGFTALGGVFGHVGDGVIGGRCRSAAGTTARTTAHAVRIAFLVTDCDSQCFVRIVVGDRNESAFLQVGERTFASISFDNCGAAGDGKGGGSRVVGTVSWLSVVFRSSIFGIAIWSGWWCLVVR